MISVFLRILPTFFLGEEEKAEQYIHLQLKEKITQQVKLQYPQLSREKQSAFVEREVRNYLRDNAEKIKQLVKTQALVNKAKFQDPSGQTYLFAIDPWHWYRLVKNYLDHGYEGDVEKKGRYYDTYIYANLPDFFRPSGTSKVNSFHVFITSILYKIIHLLNKDISLLAVLFYLSVFFSALAVVPAFFIGRKFGGAIGGFFAGLIVAFHKIILHRTMVGLYDTDAYTILFPLIIIWFFIEAYQGSLTKRLLLILASGFLMGVYSFAWIGWWYTFYLVFFGFMLIMVYKYMNSIKLKLTQFREFLNVSDIFGDIFTGFKKIKFEMLLSLVFISSSALFVFLFKGFEGLKAGFLGPFGFLTIKEISAENLWPNIFSTVDEFQTVNLIELINGIDGQLFFFLALVGFLLLSYNIKNIKSITLLGGLGWIMFWMFAIKYILKKGLANLFFIIPLVILLYVMYKKEYLKEEHDPHYNPYLNDFILLWLMLYLGVVIFLTYLFTNIIFFLALLGLPFIYIYLVKIIKESGSDYETTFEPCFAMFFLLWLFITMYSSTLGNRFVLLVIPPFAYGFSFCISYLIEMITPALSSALYLTKTVVKIIMVIFFIALLTPPLISAYTLVKSATPAVTDTWYDSLTYIKENSAKNAVIISWWDFGHWFKAIADRPVAIDGGTQSAQQIVYIGKLLLTSDEKESAAILRVLSCASYGAFETMKIFFKYDEIKTRDVLEQIMMLPKDQATEVLKTEGFAQDKVEQILDYTHCKPPQTFLILSYDMIFKTFVWAQVGSWDIKRAQILQYANKNKQTEAIAFMETSMNMTEEQAQTSYAELKKIKNAEEKNKWVSPQLRYHGVDTYCEKKNEAVVCKNKIILNLTTGEVYIQDGDKKFYASYASYLNQNNSEFTIFKSQVNDTDLKLNKLNASESGISIFKGADNKYSLAVMDNQLVGSMFNRLYFYNGTGLKCFKLFHEAQIPASNEKLSIWEVNWSCLE
ncbi:hypothetical protein HYY69_05105 [Candidatus Woesearchaeota archaeon]|nr:hypothetical protein [Candidatus Woesearchaeota archaeon]